MTLSSRHKIRNLSHGGLRPSTLPLGHRGSPQYWLSHVDGEETFFVSFKPPRPGAEPRALAWKAAVLTTTLRPPPYLLGKMCVNVLHLNILSQFLKDIKIMINIWLILGIRRQNIVFSPLSRNMFIFFSISKVAKSRKGRNKQCRVDGMLGVGNHISHYLLPILNTFQVDDKKINRLLQKYCTNKMAAIFSHNNFSIVRSPGVEPCKWI